MRKLLTKIGRFSLAQIPIEVRPVRFLQTRTQSEIGKFEVALGVQQQVVGLDVPVDEAQLVYGVDGQCSFRDVELRALLRERVLFHEECHHVAAGQEFHY